MFGNRHQEVKIDGRERTREGGQRREKIAGFNGEGTGVWKDDR